MTAPIQNMAGSSGDARPTLRASTVACPLHGGINRFDPPETTSPASAGDFSGFMVTLPLPPSTNNLFITVGRRRAPSPDYKRWIEAAGWALAQERLTPVTERYALLLAVAQAMRGDLDNRLKAVGDLLVKHELTPDDRRADLVLAHRSKAVAGKACIVTVVPTHQVSAALAGVGGGPKPSSAHPRRERAEAV